ncbi:MAG: helix-turn-helix transcriptional regulator [Lachnospiraceae bacterium]|mgnify:CR=1 FL=1|nr:helix-turn-helix transcriptional regulator [Lachnospiraceae bacterium]
MYNYDSLWRTMKERGVTTYSLVNHYNISSHTMSNIRRNENITMETLHKLCQILRCQASDVVEITFDEEEEKHYREIRKKKRTKSH